MNRSIVYTSEQVIDVASNRMKTCFICNVRIPATQIRNIDQLFYVEQKNDNQIHNGRNNESKSLATILADILEQPIDEELVIYFCF